MAGYPPAGYSKLRACLRCRMIKTEDQWMNEGCQNCESLEIKNDIDHMINCTSAKFEGMISLIKPEQSWVAKWNRIENRLPGCYALDVQGILPDEMPEEDDEEKN